MSDSFNPLRLKIGDISSSAPVFKGLPEGVVLKVINITSDGVHRSIFFNVSLFDIYLGTMTLNIQGYNLKWEGLQ